MLITFEVIAEMAAHILVGNAFFGYLVKDGTAYNVHIYKNGLRSEALPFIKAKGECDTYVVLEGGNDAVRGIVVEALDQWHQQVMADRDDPQPDECDLCRAELTDRGCPDEVCPRAFI